MELIAHRGNGNKNYKENTMDAFQSALANPCISGIELDVRETKDHKFVVIHNQLINQTSDGSGFVKNKTLEELRTYNFGSKEYPSKISTLKEVLKIVPNSKKVLVELKEEGTFPTSYLKRLYQEVKPFLKKELYFVSFNKRLLQELKKKYPHLKVGICISSVINRGELNKTYDFQAVAHSLYKEVDLKMETFFWTVNKKETYDKIKRYYPKDSYGIVTDYPSLFA